MPAALFMARARSLLRAAALLLVRMLGRVPAPDEVAAVVSRGGRPDLAGAWLRDVRAPVLLIVGESDTLVLELNREAQLALGESCALAVVPAATHLFEEPGALEEVSLLAGDWFERHLVEATAQWVTSP